MKIKPLLVLLPAFTLLVLMHNASTPIFEAPDEVWHYAYVRWLAEGHGLPSMDDDASGANQEVAQPPLYYAAAALLSAPFPDNDLDSLMWGNPGFGYQSSGTMPDNKNMLIHTDRERWPWHGAALTIHITRLTSLLFGLATVIAAWGLGYETFGTQRGARITAMLVAFHPQFVFMSSVVSNDSAAAALSTAALWAVARVLRRGITLRRAVITGALVGLAALTKTSAILLLPLAGAALLGVALRDAPKNPAARETRARFGNRGYGLACVVVYGLVALTVGGWWYGRNFVLYGDPLGISNHADTPWGRAEIILLPELLPELPLLLRSFWAAYGWGHVTWADWVYGMLWGFALVLLAHSLWRTVRVLRDARHNSAETAQATTLIFALAWFGGILVALLRWMQQVEAPHGRLLFPAIGAFAVLLAYGMKQEARSKGQEARSKGQETRSRKQEAKRQKVGSQLKVTCPHTPTPLHPYTPTSLRIAWIARVYITTMFALTALAPAARILATFAPPRMRPSSTITKGLTPAGIDYAKQAQLLGVSVSADRATPGEIISVKACWEALMPMNQDYTVFVHLIGPENSRVAERHTYPGLGRFPTSLWPAGRAFCDTYRVQIAPWAETPMLYQLQVGLFDAETGERLSATHSDGSPADPPVVAGLNIVPAELVVTTPTYATNVTVGNAIVLRGYDVPRTAAPGETISVTLHWEVRDAPGVPLTAFVHLWRPGDNAPLAQHDGVPRQGWYPTTVWQRKDSVPDTHLLAIPDDMPPGTYPLWAGLYRTKDGVRLAVTGDEGGYPYELVPLGTLNITQ